MNINSDVTGVILAGGQARRMGGKDKGLIRLNDKPMIEYIIAAFKPQTSKLLINANRNHEVYSSYGIEIIADNLSGFCGPLAGMASALQTIKTEYMVTAPCDSPFIPADLVQRLATAIENESADISVAHNGDRIQPVFCMLKKSLAQSLNGYLAKGERKIDRWFEQHNYAVADFSDVPTTFDNINTPEDIENALSRVIANND
jgi:molybdopterin-guanine dinucleotide biosynthesis protein A